MYGLRADSIRPEIQFNRGGETMTRTQPIKRTFVVTVLLAAAVMVFAMSGVASAEAAAPQPDLSVDVSGSSTVVVGDNIKSLSITVSNEGDPMNGTAVDGFGMKIVVNSTWAGAPADPFLFIPKNGIPTGDFHAWTFDNVIPANSMWGNSLEICAEVEFGGYSGIPSGSDVEVQDGMTFDDDGKGGAVTEANEWVFDSNPSNNKDCHTIEFLKPSPPEPELPDFVVDVTGPGSWTVSNVGGSLGPQMEKLELSLYINGTGPYAWPIDLFWNGFPAGESKTFSLPFAANQLCVLVRPNADFAESDYSNNVDCL